MLSKMCPKCGLRYYEQDNFCRKCGNGLEKDANQCGGNKFSRCAHISFADDDNYCPSCGSLTTYALERQKK